MIVLLVGGALSAMNLKSEVFPTISPGTVVVTVPYPGATPAEVEEGITRRVEEAVLGIDGVKRVTSSASENAGIITIETNDFADRGLVKDDVEIGRRSTQRFSTGQRGETRHRRAETDRGRGNARRSR